MFIDYQLAIMIIINFYIKWLYLKMHKDQIPNILVLLRGKRVAYDINVIILIIINNQLWIIDFQESRIDHW